MRLGINLAGVLADAFGKKFTLVVAGETLVLGIIGYSVSSHLLVLIIFIFLIGFGLGSLELSGSNIISEIQPKNKGRYLNVLNAFYRVGAVITPVLAGYLLNVGISWRLIYQYSLVVVVPIIIYFLVMKYPKSNTDDEESNKIHFRSLLRIIAKKEILLMYLVIFAYVATEIGMATWMVDFLQKAKGISAAISSLYLSIHFVGIMIGRFLGSLFVDKLGHLKSLLLFTILAIICITIGVYGPSSIAGVLALTGLCFSIIFPTSTAVVSEIPIKNSGTMLGIFLAFGGLGGMVEPWLIGIVTDYLGLKSGMATNIMFCIIIMFTLIILLKSKPKAHVQ